MPRPRLLLSAVLLSACSPAQPQPRPVDTVASAPQDAGPAAPEFASPARWTLTSVPSAAASLAIESGTLAVGEGGERWIEHADGTFEAASDLAPEPLHGVAGGGAGYRFIGQSGAIYEASVALGPLRRSGDPVADARAVVLGDKAAFAIDPSGELLRSPDGGRAWAKVQVGPRDGVLVGIAAVGREALAIAAPQRLFASKDDGATWKPIPSPGLAIGRLRAEYGSVVAATQEGDRRFDFGSETFVETSSRPRKLGARGARPLSYRTALDGRTAVVIESDNDAHTHRVAVFDLGAKMLPKKLDALDGCVEVHAAVRGSSVALACDAVATADGAIDKTPGNVWRTLRSRTPVATDGGRGTGMLTRVLRSEDGGKSFAEETTLEGGQPDDEESIAIGPDGWAFLGRRCAPAAFGRSCTPARVRTNAGAPWAEVAGGDDAPRQQEFAGNGAQKVLYSVGWHDGETILYRWQPSAATPESVTSLTTTPAHGVALSLDANGVVRGFVRTQQASAFEVQGTTLHALRLPDPKAASGAFFGKFGLVTTSSNVAQETIDGGKTWHAVTMPKTMQVTRCSSDGCLTTRGFRAGWDAQAAPTRPAPESAPLYAKPLKCKATGAWVALGGGQLPSVANADLGAARWILPTRDAPGSVTLLSSRWADSAMATTRTPLVGPAPQPPTYGAATTVHVQPAGIVVLRYSYPRARKGLGAYNPVDMQAVWYRAATGKILKAAPIKLDPFRVSRDPQYGVTQTPAFGEPPTMLSLGPRGLWFHPPTYSDNETLYHLRDDGRVERTKMAGEMVDGVTRVADAGGNPLLAVESGAGWTVWSPVDGKRTSLGVMGGLDDDEAHVDVLDFGGKPVFIGTLRWSKARAWAIPIGLAADLGPASPVPTQLSLGDVPRACAPGAADPKDQRLVLPWVRGARRPVTVDVDGKPRVLASGGVAARVPASGDACAVAIEAAADGEALPEESDTDQTDEYSALVFPADPGGSLLFKVHGPDWPSPVSVRPLSCAFEPGPLPKELENTAGFSKN